MNIKIMVLLMFVMLFTTPVLAAITVTINTPASGTAYNNLLANVSPVDINFSVTDDNATVADHNLTVIIYNGTTWPVATETLVNDKNVRNLPTGTTCEPVTVTSGLAAYTCNTHWDMPGETSMPEGSYYIDVNITSVFSAGSASDTHIDTNATTGITISNSITNSATIQALLLVISMVIFAGLLIIAVVSIGVIGTDPAKTAVALVGAGVVVAVLMSILGIIALMI